MRTVRNSSFTLLLACCMSLYGDTLIKEDSSAQFSREEEISSVGFSQEEETSSYDSTASFEEESSEGEEIDPHEACPELELRTREEIQKITETCKKRARCFAQTDLLQNAAESGCIELVQELISLGADDILSKGKKPSALWLAVQNGHLRVAKLLLEHDKIKSGYRNNYGAELSLAARENNLALVKLLLEYGADADYRGLPLESAIAHINAEMVSCLLAHGASVYSKDGADNYLIKDLVLSIAHDLDKRDNHYSNSEQYAVIAKLLRNHGAHLSSQHRDSLNLWLDIVEKTRETNFCSDVNYTMKKLLKSFAELDRGDANNSSENDDSENSHHEIGRRRLEDDPDDKKQKILIRLAIACTDTERADLFAQWLQLSHDKSHKNQTIDVARALYPLHITCTLKEKQQKSAQILRAVFNEYDNPSIKQLIERYYEKFVAVGIAGALLTSLFLGYHLLRIEQGYTKKVL